jgi:isoquinoline 1-oxidoreductase beta subunit
MDRREFLTWSLRGGLALAVSPRIASAQATELSPWITLHADGTVSLVATAFEMGQGSRTGQAQILADELDVPWEAIRVVMATERDPYLVNGALFSGGSETVRTRYELLRKAGASVRWQLVAAAAKSWDVDPATCAAALGEVSHAPTARKLRYGDLAADAARIAPPADPPLKPAAQRRYIGMPISTLEQADKVNGRAKYGIDFRLPGMAFATIRQCPFFGGTLKSVDDRAALAVRGVRKVIALHDAVAVVADTTWQAFKGAAALDPQWSVEKPVPSSPEIARMLEEQIDAPGATVAPQQGGAAMRERLRAAYASAGRRHEATYELAYISHSPLEPMNATARPSGDGVEVWAPCQAPTWAREDAAAICGLAKEKIAIHPLLMGGGFGRRLKGDYIGRAAQVALAFGGPVQLVWTREEDMTHDFYRPAMRMTFRAALPAEGVITGYEVLAATTDDLTGGTAPSPYSIADRASTLSQVKVGVPVGSWRSVDPGMAVFAKESFIDECAHAMGMDPLAYRDRLLGTNERARRVLAAAAKAIGWPAKGAGFAMLDGWDTLVAHAVRVEIARGKLRVARIVAAVDCGTAVNPQQVRAQFEGGGLMGLSAAIGERITILDGRATPRNFDEYHILRMSQAPRIDVILLETPDAKVGGAGEPPVPGIAPALANAIFSLTGKRLRSLPMDLADPSLVARA